MNNTVNRVVQGCRACNHLKACLSRATSQLHPVPIEEYLTAETAGPELPRQPLSHGDGEQFRKFAIIARLPRGEARTIVAASSKHILGVCGS